LSTATRPDSGAIAIDGLSEIADRFDALIVDQYGVLHDGSRSYPEAVKCLEALDRADKTVVVLSNSGRRVAANRERLAALGFDARLFHAMVTSGEVVWQSLAARDDVFHAALGRRCYLIGESGEAEFLEGLDLDPVAAIEDADFVLLLGIDTPRRSLDEHQSMLERAARLKLPMLCANSDIVRFTTSGLQPAPGALARRYEAIGGMVRWYGKPLAAIYDRCLDAMDGIDRHRVLGVGDSIEHDVAGATAAGLRSVYVRGGIDFDGKDVSRPTGLARPPDYVTDRFRW
jgi:HAD superfamily hydrolase (TIGR01459 family)